MTETTPASNDYWNQLVRITMTVQCPICNLIYKTSDEVVAYPCKRCGWKGKWKQEIAPEDEITKEIEHPALRGCH